MKDEKTLTPMIHMVKETLKFTKTRNICLTNTKNMLRFEKKKDTNQNFNDVAFPKQVCSFYIAKYILV